MKLIQVPYTFFLIYWFAFFLLNHLICELFVCIVFFQITFPDQGCYEIVYSKRTSTSEKPENK